MPAEGVPRWCIGCTHRHPGAVTGAGGSGGQRVGTVPRPQKGSYGRRFVAAGLPLLEQAWWCVPTGHAGAVDIANAQRKKCEDCRQKVPCFGRHDENLARWCSGCAKQHDGAVDVVHKKCNGCAKQRATHEGLCSGCAKARKRANLETAHLLASLADEHTIPARSARMCCTSNYCCWTPLILLTTTLLACRRRALPAPPVGQAGGRCTFKLRGPCG